MAFLTWTSDLDTGIEKIDFEHRKIVEKINRLHAAQAAGDRAAIGGLMEEMIQYTATHFREEEELMRRSGYEYVDAHKGVHDRFVDKVTALHRSHLNGNDTAEQLADLLGNWLFSHIKLNDRAYVEAMKAAGVN